MGAAPRCRDHRLHILSCLSCCMSIYESVGLWSVDDRHRWAIENIYVPMEEW